MASFIFTHSLYAASANGTPGCFLYASSTPRLEFTTPPLPALRYCAMSCAVQMSPPSESMS